MILQYLIVVLFWVYRIYGFRSIYDMINANYIKRTPVNSVQVVPVYALRDDPISTTVPAAESVASVPQIKRCSSWTSKVHDILISLPGLQKDQSDEDSLEVVPPVKLVCKVCLEDVSSLDDCCGKTCASCLATYIRIEYDTNGHKHPQCAFCRKDFNIIHLSKSLTDDEINNCTAIAPKLSRKSIPLKIRFSTVGCPKCGVRIFRQYGCNYMTCSKCNTHFCYKCRGSSCGAFKCRNYLNRIRTKIM